jgi:hypothetical protein
MRRLDVRIGDGPKSELNPEGIRVFDVDTSEDVTNQCAWIDFIPRRGYIWSMFLLNADGRKYMDMDSHKGAATELGQVVCVKGRLRYWIRSFTALISKTERR